MRRLIPLLAFVVVAALLWVMVGSGGAEPPPRGVALEDADVPDAERTSGATEPERLDASGAASGTGARTALPAGEYVPVDLVRVRVTRKSTGAPVPEAEVSYVESFSTVGFSQAEREEYVRLLADNEGLTRRYGTTVVADDEGLALIALQEFGRVTSRSGDLYGELFIERQPGDEDRVHELELERDVTLEVRVVDSAGAPAAEVPVTIQPQGLDGEAVGSAIRLGITRAPSGSFRIDHLQMRYQGLDSYILRADIPGLTEGGVPLERDNPLTYPVVLRLPVTGSVVVRTTGVGGGELPSELRSAVSLAIAPEESPDGGQQSPAVQKKWEGRPVGGGMRFEWVVTGKSYVAASSPAEQYVQEVFRGPTVFGQEVHVTLGLESEPYFLVGRAVDDQLEPYRKASLSVELALPRGSSPRHDVQTDEEGRFRLHLRIDERADGSEISRLTIREQTGRRPGSRPDRMYASRESFPLAPGDNDLGDVVLGEASLVVSGQIFVDGRPGDDRFRLRVRRAGGRPTADPRAVFSGVDPDIQVHVMEAGRFEIRGAPRYARYRVESISFGYLPMTPVEFAPGDEDLRIELDSGGSLRAELLGDDSVPLSRLAVQVVAPDGSWPQLDMLGAVPQIPTNGGIPAIGPESRDGRHTYSWRALRPGKYRFEVRLPGRPSPLVTVPDVEVVAGENRDPRLEGIDLQGRFREFNVTVVGSDRKPIPATSGKPIVLIREPAAQQLAGFEVTGGHATVIAAAQYVDLLVLARGHMPREVFRVSSDIEVRLEPFPVVQVRIAGWEEARPRNHTILVSLENQESRSLGNRLVVYEGGSRLLGQWLDPLTKLQEATRTGEVVLPVNGAGSYFVRASLQNEVTGGTGAVVGIDPSEIDLVEGQVIEIRISEEALNNAVEAAGRR